MSALFADTYFFVSWDKEWSVTDCISFTVMKDKSLTRALTGDHHFGQAGFAIVFKST
jgi:uncharacterized protein